MPLLPPAWSSSSDSLSAYSHHTHSQSVCPPVASYICLFLSPPARTLLSHLRPFPCDLGGGLLPAPAHLAASLHCAVGRSAPIFWCRVTALDLPPLHPNGKRRGIPSYPHHLSESERPTRAERARATMHSFLFLVLAHVNALL